MFQSDQLWHSGMMCCCSLGIFDKIDQSFNCLNFLFIILTCARTKDVSYRDAIGRLPQICIFSDDFTANTVQQLGLILMFLFRCRREMTGNRVEFAMAPWTYAFVRCRTVGPITIAVCDNSCRNPLTQKQLDRNHYRPQNITYQVELLHWNGSRKLYDLAVACKCVKLFPSSNRERDTNTQGSSSTKKKSLRIFGRIFQFIHNRVQPSNRTG